MLDRLGGVTPLRIAQISDFHCGEITFDPDVMKRTIDTINEMQPDLCVVAGDLTAAGYEWEYEEARRWLDQLTVPILTVMGNHDARNVGYLHFQRLFGDLFPTSRIEFDDERSSRLDATGVTIVGVDSSEPDLNEGKVGREKYDWIQSHFHSNPDDIKIFVVHHHLVPVPGAGRERNVVSDAGDLLAKLTTLDVDIVLCGHKHVPWFWGLNGMLICNSGTTATRRLRGMTPPSWNEIEVDSENIYVFLHHTDGSRQLSCVRGRITRHHVRSSFQLTDEFLETNRVGPFF